VNALRLAHPEWQVELALAVVLLALAVGLAGHVARRRRRRLLGDRARLASATFSSDAALVVAFAAIVVALLGPRIGERTLRVPASGVDVVFALDVSRSMDAADVPPSRLDRARRAVAGALARLEPFDRVGLVGFAGVGVLLAPLTPDRAVIGELLSGIDTGLVSPASSDVGAGVEAALSAFEAGSGRPRIVVVLGDGEDPERRRDLGAASAARADARVLVAAFGTETGATLPDHGVPLVDRSGRTVVSRRDLERLGVLASASDGELFAADEWGEVDLVALVRAIRRDAGAAPGTSVERRVPAVRILPFAALAFLLLLIEGMPRRSSRPPGGGLRTGVARASALAALLLLVTPAPAGGNGETLSALEALVREQPSDPARLIALGAARLERGQRRAAERAFLAAAVRARTPKEAAIAYYDLGVAALEQGELERARSAFLDALAFAPDDAKARFNLEWTTIALRQSDPSPAPEADLPPEPETSPEPEPEAEPDPTERREQAATPSVPEPAPLSEAEQRRWLERIQDDPSRALRSAAGETRRPDRAGVPVW
jgi:Ca-activated chloride channel family protein